jgi:hypothetical protein
MEIIKQSLAKNATQKELQKTLIQMQLLLQFTMKHLEKTDSVISITVQGKTHTLTIKPN